MINNMLKERRLELGLTMKQVAEAVGVSEGTVSRWESGEISNMKRSRIAALAKVLNIKPSDIVLGTSSNMSNEESNADREFYQLLSTMTEEEKIWLLNIIKSVIEGRK